MEITSLYFGLISIIAVFIFYNLKQKLRLVFLAILSCGFIATYSYFLLLYVIAYTLINFYFGIIIPDSGRKRGLFRIGIIINLSQLIVLKYASFTIDPIFRLFEIDYNLSGISDIIIPVGISFFTLQGIGYLINIYLGWEKSEKSFFPFLLYITFYPRFLSGPIERSNHFLPQLKEIKSFDGQEVTEGVRLALFGVFKKVVIANQLAPFVFNSYTNLDSISGISVLVLILIQPLYLYFDFSGYTDIAIGLAKTFGINLRPNFNRPFLSENMTNFWKRFHISLSTWFHDYVFIRTNFKFRRWGFHASTFAIFLTWILFGIWHGAGWNFMLLGLLQAIAIYYEFVTKKWRARLFSKLPGNLKVWIGRLLTYLFYGVSLIFFFAPDLGSVGLCFSNLFSAGGFVHEGIRLEILYMVLIFMIIFLLLEILENDFKVTYDRMLTVWLSQHYVSLLFRWGFYILLITAIIVMGNEVQQFIYFQF